jgi:hypothetical protein
MSLAALAQVYDEVRRLAVAGSALAAGDFRLKKLIPPLEKSGEKAPVFAKVAQAVQKLVDAGQKESAGALLELNSLTTAILYTQGETGRAGEFQPIVSSNTGLTIAHTSARTLKPLLEALTTTGSGRLETIKEAHERGAFKDLRLMKPALKAIDDPYPEVGEYVAEKILPMYGKPIYAEVKEALDLKGKGNQARRLKLLHQLDPAATHDLVEKALDEGSKDVKLQAIECLGGASDAIPYLLEQASARASDVRRAALQALLSFTDEVVVDVLEKAASTEDVFLLGKRLAANPSPRLRGFVLRETNRLCEELLTGEGEKQPKKGKAKAKGSEPSLSRFRGLLDGLTGRTDPEAVELLSDLFAKRGEISKIKGDVSGQDVVGDILELVLTCQSKPALKALGEAWETVDPAHIHMTMMATSLVLKPKDVHARFAPVYLSRGNGKGKTKAAADAHLRSEQIGWLLQRSARRVENGSDDEDDGEPRLGVEIDPKWLDTAIELNDLETVMELAKPEHAGSMNYLSKWIDGVIGAKKFDPDYTTHRVLDRMVELKHPEIVDKFIAILKRPWNFNRSYYGIAMVAYGVPRLPASAIPRLEALLPDLHEKIVDVLVPVLAEMKQTAAAENP